MAIIDSLPALSVSVRLRTSFRDASEYPDPNPYLQRERYLDDFERCSRNYIESEDGVEFAVHLDVRDEQSLDHWVYGDHGLMFVLFVDGQFMGQRFCHSDDFFHGRWHFTFKGRRHPNETRSALIQRDFKFESITTVDDDATTQEIRRARDLGTIEVKVKLGRFSGIPHRERNRAMKRPLWEPRYDSFDIPEEALKGRSISHGTSFAKPYEAPLRPPRRQQRAAFEKIHTGPLLATYTFKYRSQEALKIEQIVPRTPSVEPFPLQDPNYFEQPSLPRFEELGHDEVERLARERLRQLEDESLQGSGKKRSYDDFCDLTEDEYGQPPRPYKVTKLWNGQQVIDLTSCY